MTHKTYSKDCKCTHCKQKLIQEKHAKLYWKKLIHYKNNI